MARVYFHVDLNAFFANAEILLDPSLKGKPVAISGMTRRSVVSTASYEARKFGVHSAQPVSEALKLCRDLIVIPGHYHWYHELSEQFIAIVRSYSPLLEQASVDECYVDVTDVIRRYQRPLDLAVELQQRILKELGLPCSIGVAPNMFLAKMASDMKKPMGITVLRIRDVKEKMWPLPISEMRGIGKKTLPYMEEMNIRTIGDLAVCADPNSLKPIFGRNTEEIIRKANGYDRRELVTEWDARSMGVSETLLEDITDYDEIRGLLRSLSRKLSARLKEDHKAGWRLTVRICYYDFRNVTRSRRASKPIWRADELFMQAMEIFEENYDEEDAVRLLGISVDDFADADVMMAQMNLFEEPDSREEVAVVLKELNHQLGSKGFMRASDLLRKE